MAGLLDTIIAKRASQDALARQAANEAALSTTPDEKPGFADVTPMDAGMTQERSALVAQPTASRQFEAGVYDVKGGIKNAMAAAAQALGGDPLSLRKSALEDQRAADRVADPNSVSDIREIDGPTKLGSFVFGQAARGAPMIGAMGIGAGLGAAAGMPALAGAGAASLALNTGETYGQTHEEIDRMKAAGQLSPEKEQELRGNALRDSTIAGTLNAALDTSSFGILFKANPIAKSAMAKVLAPSLMGHVGRSLLAEGGTEALQEYISIAAQKHALEKPEMFGLTSEEAWQLANAGAAGASMAAPFAPVGHFGRRINDGVDAGLNAVGGAMRKVSDAGGVVNMARGALGDAGTAVVDKAKGLVPSMPGDPETSLGTKMGKFAAAVVDADPVVLKQYGAEALDTLSNIPGVKQAMGEGSDFMSALRGSKRVAKIENFLETNSGPVQQGFKDFMAAVGKADTGNIESTYARYKTMLAHAIGAEGVNSENLDQLGANAGAKLASFISGFNEKLPQLESSTGALFNTAKGVAQEGVKVAQGAVAAAKAGTGAVGAAARSFQAGAAQVKSALRSMADSMKGPEEPGVKESKSAVLSKSALAMRGAFLDAMELDPEDIQNGATLMVKRLDAVLRRSPEEFDQLVEANKEHIADAFDMGPDEFKNLVRDTLEKIGDERLSRKTRIEQEGEKYGGMVDKETGLLLPGIPRGHDVEASLNADERQEVSDWENMSEAEIGSIDEMIQDGFNNVGGPRDASGVDNPHMDQPTFDQMFAREGNHQGRWVYVTKTTTDRDTGEVIDETREPVKVDLIRVAKAWQRHTAANGRVSEQQNMDTNFKEGIAALFGGWQASTEDGHHVDVKVQPARRNRENGVETDPVPLDDFGAYQAPYPEHGSENLGNAARNEDSRKNSIRRAGLKGWLQGEAKVGRGDRTVKDLEKAGKARRLDVAGQIDAYYKTVGKDPSAQNKLRAADNVAREVVDTIRDAFSPSNEDQYTPEGKQLRVERMNMFLVNPAVFGDTGAAIRAGVHPALATLPPDIRQLAHGGLVARLSELEEGLQGGLQGEQETSMDNPDRASDDVATGEHDEVVTEDLAGDYINYGEVQEAGEIPLPVNNSKEQSPRSVAAAREAQAAGVKTAREMGPRSFQAARTEVDASPTSARNAEEPIEHASDAGPLPKLATVGIKPGRGEIKSGEQPALGPTRNESAPAAKPYAENSRTPAAKEDNPLDFDRETAKPGQHDNPLNDPARQLYGKRQRPDVKGKVNPGVEGLNRKPREPKPPGEREALGALKKLYARTESAAGKAILEEAMNRVKSGHVLAEGLAKLAADGLKPSDIKAILAQKWTKARFDAEKKKVETAVLHEGAAPKKAEPAAAPAGVKKSLYGAVTVAEEDPADHPEGKSGFFKVKSGAGEWIGDDGPGSDEFGYYDSRANAEAAAQRIGALKSQAKARAGEATVNSTDPAVQKEITDAIQKIAGKTLGVEFDKHQKHEGQYDAARKVVTMAATLGLSSSNAFHEAFHAVFRYLSPDQRKQLYRAFRSTAVRKQIQELLADSPDAWESARQDPEELLAYGFQFWHNGLLKLNADTSTLMGKIADFLVKAKAWILDRPSTQELLQQIKDGVFADGPPSPVEIALAKQKRTFNAGREILAGSAKKLGQLYDAVLKPFDDRVRETGNPHLDWIARQMYTQVGEKRGERGFAQVEREVATRFQNQLAKLAQDPEYHKGLEDRATGVKSRMADAIGKFTDELHQYARDAGVDMGYVEDFLPMSWSGDKIAAQKKQFIALLAKHQPDLDKLNAKLKKQSGKTDAGGFADMIGGSRDQIYAGLLAEMNGMNLAQLNAQVKSREKRLPTTLDGDLQDLMETEIEILKEEIEKRGEQTGVPTETAAPKKPSGKFKPFTPESIWEMMSKRGLDSTEFSGNAFDENGAPNADFTLNRVFGFLSNEERRPFVRDNLAQGLSRYAKQITRRAEWTRRFGDKNELWDKKMEQAREYGVSPEEEKLMSDYKDAALGAKLHDLSPTMRKVIAGVTVYQNMRVLGLALLGSIVDPMGIAVRSGEWSEATKAYKTAIGRIFKSGRLKTAQLEELAETMGILESAGMADSIANMYGGVDIEGVGKSINDKLFTYNGMNGLTRSVRIAALAAGTRFIAKHGAGVDGETSKRHLAELGLKPDEVKVVNGQLQIDEKIQAALNRFVDEAAMRPNVGERTKWGADPTFALLYHLKQYIFSFNKVINKKHEHELLEHGNPQPMLMAMAYIPMMAGASIIRDAIYNAGSLPEKNGFLHYLSAGVHRSGLLGPSDMATQAITGGFNGVRSALGPTVDQAIDALGAAANPRNTELYANFVKESLPLGSIIQHY